MNVPKNVPMKLGKYTIQATLRADNPAFPKYQIFAGGKLIGTQFSVPCLTDCEWHERQGGQYAQPVERKVVYGYTAQTMRRRGRPTNAERARREAMLLTETPE